MPPYCGCASYVALRQFGNKVGGSWPDANSLASQRYWNAGYLQFNRSNFCPQSSRSSQSWRYRNDVPQAGDVMIMQNGSRFWLQNSGRPQTAIFAGHTGFVTAAAYKTGRTFASDPNRYGGWDLTLQSANWGCYDASANRKTYADLATGCRNLSEVPIFVPNGGSVSFWREVKTPLFFAIVPARQAIGKALAPSTDPQKQPAVVQAPRDPADDSQIWVFEILPEKDYASQAPYMRIVNYKSGKCLDLSGGSSANGAPIIEWPCNNGDNQKWRITTIYSPLEIRSKLSGKSLDVPNGTQDSYAPIIQWEPNGGGNQKFFLEEVTPPGCGPAS
jgi:hypothetical protein